MKNENVVVKKECHSRGMLSGISRVLSRYAHKEKALFMNNPYVGDPRLRHSGMTSLCNNGAFTLIEQVGQALPDNAPAKGHLAAFTLIELLVVILIIGILAAVALPQYKIAGVKSRVSTLLPIMNAIVKADEAYYLANGEYAFQLEKLDIDVPNNCTPITGDGETTYVNPKYKCGNDFLIDFSYGTNKARALLSYCPGANTNANDCKQTRDFMIGFRYFHVDDKPGQIRCSVYNGSTLGKKICNTLFPKQD